MADPGVEGRVVRQLMNRIALCALIVAVGGEAAARDSIGARVAPAQGIAPCDIVIQAFIEPNERNRSVSFEVDSGVFFVRSVIEVDGDRGPRTREVRFRNMPAGTYIVLVTLFGDDGGERDRLERTVTLQ
jgi:hypothetical protein